MSNTEKKIYVVGENLVHPKTGARFVFAGYDGFGNESWCDVVGSDDENGEPVFYSNGAPAEFLMPPIEKNFVRFNEDSVTWNASSKGMMDYINLAKAMGISLEDAIDIKSLRNTEGDTISPLELNPSKMIESDHELLKFLGVDLNPLNKMKH
jgi:hypothetical protein